MAAYPSYPQLVDSREEWIDDLVADRAVNGSVKVRAMFSSKKKRFLLKHRLTKAQIYTDYAGTAANALQTFYNTNRALAVTMTWTPDATAYTCLFAGAPRLTWINPNVADVDVELLQQ